jgi:hypothetical protein
MMCGICALPRCACPDVAPPPRRCPPALYLHRFSDDVPDDVTASWRYYAWWSDNGEANGGRYFIFTHPTHNWGVHFERLTIKDARAIRGTAQQDMLSAAAGAYAATLGALDA